MLQQIIAIIILIIFVLKLNKEWRKKNIGLNEFIFWLVFWIIGLLIVVFIKPIDKIVMKIGFSSSGINLIFYLAVLLLFYLIFRMRIRLVKIEKNITDLSRKISLK